MNGNENTNSCSKMSFQDQNKLKRNCILKADRFTYIIGRNSYQVEDKI